VVTMLRGVERGELVAHRELVAVLLDERAHVVALERDREAGERTGHRVARRKRRHVRVDGAGLVVTGHHHHVVVRLTANRALCPELVEIRIGVGDDAVVTEEVDGIEPTHDCCFPLWSWPYVHQASGPRAASSGTHSSRSWRRSALPEGSLGIASTNTTWRSRL
jgi:hypothetical protein